MSACKLHSTEEAVLVTHPPSNMLEGVCVCSGGGSTQERTMRRRWLADRPGSVGDWASRVRVLWLSLSRAGTGARVVLKVRSLRQEHIYIVRKTPTFCSAFGRADVAVAVVATRGNGLRLLLVRRIARAVRRACCGRLKVVSYCSWASNQVRRPAEFKHITKRRKRN